MIKSILIRLYHLFFNINDNNYPKNSNLSKNNNIKSIISGLKPNLSKAKITIILIVLYAFGLLTIYSCIKQIIAPIGDSVVTEKIIKINSGMSVISIGSLLESNGLIRNSRIFQIISYLNGQNHSLKAGSYAINTGMSILEIIRKIASGQTILYKFTIPEGYTINEIAELWESSGFGTLSKFKEALNDKNLQAKYGIKMEGFEGYLFPDTYTFPYGISEQEAIENMLHQFNNKVSDLLQKNPMNMQKQDIISLASIIEKEAVVAEERPIISAVFHNRLKLGMKLESCPTVLYGLGYPKRKLTYDDLRNESLRHNTYVYKGLPPSPICNPGLSSIKAAIYPSDVKYLYFVSKNNGTHYFAENYNDFLSAKNKYQGT